ncbi:MAG TPA: hypothetical protein VIK87_07905 [Sphingomonadales bacterium]
MRRLFLALAVIFGSIASPAMAADAPRLGEPRYLTLEPVTVSVLRDSRVRGLLSLDLTLELARLDDRAQIERIMPRLRDQFVFTLTRLAASRLDVDQPLDLPVITAALQEVTDRVLGESRARLLIGGATLRRL